MRVIIFINSLGIGGTEKFLTYTLPRLKRMRITVVTWGRLDLAPELIRGGIEVKWLVGNKLAVFFGVLSIIRANRDSIVHFYLPEAYLIGGIAGVLAGHKRMIMSRRSLNEYQHKHRIAALIERRLHKRMMCILANCNAVRDELLAEGAPPDKVGLIYSGVPM